MTDPARRAALLAATVLVLAACGGGGGGGGSGTGSGGTATQAPAEATDAPAPEATEAPEATPQPEATAGGPATGGVDACALATPAELDGVFGTTGISTQLFAGPPDTCSIELDGTPLGAFVYTPAGGRTVFDLLHADEAAVDVAGMGDAAFYSSQTGLLSIAKGDAMLSIAVVAGDRSEEERLELMKAIGTIAAGRL